MRPSIRESSRRRGNLPPSPSPVIGDRLSFRAGAITVPHSALLRNFYEQKSTADTSARGDLPSASRVLARDSVRGAYQSQAAIRHPHRSSMHIRQAARAKCRIQGDFAINHTTRIIRYANSAPRMIYISTTFKSFAGALSAEIHRTSPAAALIPPQISVTTTIIRKIRIPRASSGAYKRAAC